jgi:hypothetical protein
MEEVDYTMQRMTKLIVLVFWSAKLVRISVGVKSFIKLPKISLPSFDGSLDIDNSDQLELIKKLHN